MYLFIQSNELKFQSKRLFTKVKSSIGLAVLGGLLIALNLHFIWTRELVVLEFAGSVLKWCSVVHGYYFNFTDVVKTLNKIDVCTYDQNCT